MKIFFINGENSNPRKTNKIILGFSAFAWTQK